jgi:hypothetical protein
MVYLLSGISNQNHMNQTYLYVVTFIYIRAVVNSFNLYRLSTGDQNVAIFLSFAANLR